MIALHYAEILQGYNIRKSLRPGHINIFVRASALPWKTPKKLLGIESIIPINSVFERRYTSFHKKTGFEFDLIPYSDSAFNKYMSLRTLDYVSGDTVCKILNVQASVEIIKSTLALGQEKIGEKSKRILLHLDEISDSAIKLGDRKIQMAAKKISRQYAPLHKERHQSSLTGGEITGDIVYGDLVNGKVFLVTNPDTPLKKNVDLTDRILVCPRISKRLAMYISQVAAIVTDDGGILSHAAIIAREMKKPCVIGTKIATQVLKHGETVRVDAAKGTITRVGAVKRHRSTGNRTR